MTQIEINGSETDTLYLFHLDLPREAISRFTQQAGTGEWPLKYGLGAKDLRPAFVDVVDLRDLGEMPLSRFLKEAHGVSSATLNGQTDQINRLKGHVVILPSQAFNTVSQTLNVAAPLRFIGKFEETHGKRGGAKLRSPSAQEYVGTEGNAPQAKARIMRWVLAGLALIVVVALMRLLT